MYNITGLKKLGMLLHHRHQTWTFLLHKNGCSSNIEWMLGLDINRTWLFLHHSVKGGSSDYTQWSLLCAPLKRLYFQLLFHNSTQEKWVDFHFEECDQQDPHKDDEAMTMSSTTEKKMEKPRIQLRTRGAQPQNQKTFRWNILPFREKTAKSWWLEQRKRISWKYKWDHFDRFSF